MRISDWSSDVYSSDLLGCEEEDYPHIRNIPLVGELGVNSIGEVWVKTENANVDVGGTINVSDNPTPEEMVRRHIQQLVDGGLSFDHIRLVQKVWAAQNNNKSRIRLAYFGGRPVVETEFAAFVAQTELWSTSETAPAEIGHVVDGMETRPSVE